jgi:hypothetical protein
VGGGRGRMAKRGRARLFPQRRIADRRTGPSRRLLRAGAADRLADTRGRRRSPDLPNSKVGQSGGSDVSDQQVQVSNRG